MPSCLSGGLPLRRNEKECVMNEIREVNSNDLANIEGGCYLGCFPPPYHCHPYPHHPHHHNCHEGYRPPYCGGDYDGGLRIVPL
jgi:hypothetical protein